MAPSQALSTWGFTTGTGHVADRHIRVTARVIDGRRAVAPAPTSCGVGGPVPSSTPDPRSSPRRPDTATATDPWTTRAAPAGPLARLLRTVVSGHPPIADQEWTRVSPWSPTVQGMVRLTGHTIVAVSYDVVDAQLLDLGVSAGDGAFSARVISTLAGPTGWIDAPRVLLSALGTGAGQHASLTFRSDLTRHPFVEAAQRTRQDTQVLGSVDPAAAEIVVLGRGVAGVREISVYVPPAGRGGVGAAARRWRAKPSTRSRKTRSSWPPRRSETPPGCGGFCARATPSSAGSTCSATAPRARDDACRHSARVIPLPARASPMSSSLTPRKYSSASRRRTLNVASA